MQWKQVSTEIMGSTGSYQPTAPFSVFTATTSVTPSWYHCRRALYTTPNSPVKHGEMERLANLHNYVVVSHLAQLCSADVEYYWEQSSREVASS